MSFPARFVVTLLMFAMFPLTYTAQASERSNVGIGFYPPVHLVEFVSGYENWVVDDQIIAHGDLAVFPGTAPNRAQYDFLGWYTCPDFAKAWDFERDYVLADMVLHGRWAPTPDRPNVERERPSRQPRPSWRWPSDSPPTVQVAEAPAANPPRGNYNPLTGGFGRVMNAVDVNSEGCCNCRVIWIISLGIGVAALVLKRNIKGMGGANQKPDEREQ